MGNRGVRELERVVEGHLGARVFGGHPVGKGG